MAGDDLIAQSPNVGEMKLKPAVIADFNAFEGPPQAYLERRAVPMAPAGPLERLKPSALPEFRTEEPRRAYLEEVRRNFPKDGSAEMDRIVTGLHVKMADAVSKEIFKEFKEFKQGGGADKFSIPDAASVLMGDKKGAWGRLTAGELADPANQEKLKGSDILQVTIEKPASTMKDLAQYYFDMSGWLREHTTTPEKK